MCLAVPGRIEQINQKVAGFPVGTVDFGGLSREVGLAFVPEARVGDYVIVHAGYAIAQVDQQEAETTLALLEQMQELGQSATAVADDFSPTIGSAPPA